MNTELSKPPWKRIQWFSPPSRESIALDVKKIIPCEITFLKSNDNRSYRINSDKILKVGFVPKFNSIDAIYDLKNTFDKNFKPSEINWNLNWLSKKKHI